MEWPILTAVISGLIVGAAVTYLVMRGQSTDARKFADEFLRDSEARRQESLEVIIENLKASFGSLSLDALSKSSEEFLKLARQTLQLERDAGAKDLGEKKVLIDQQLETMSSRLERFNTLVHEIENDRKEKYGELTNYLRTASESTAALNQTTNSLREALSSTSARGQWGERMAEDVLRIAGFSEKINYVKQTATAAGNFPDFTFFLPREFKLNMDVKFPLDNYMKFLDAGSETDRENFRMAFLKDVRARVKEITTREYINPEDNTVDYVLLFIPNEQIYAFIHEQDNSILDEGLRQHVVFCSPLTLFAVLAVIRQAVDNFALEQTSNEIISLLGQFKKQWEGYVKSMESLGKKLEGAQKEFDHLTTTRQRQLDKPLNKIEDIRNQRGLPVAADEEYESLPSGDIIEEDLLADDALEEVLDGE